MKHLWLAGGLMVAAAMWGGCHSPTSPTPSHSTIPAPPVIAPPVPSAPFPPLSGPYAIYAFRDPLVNFGSVRVTPTTERSRFVLYDNGAFYLQYDTLEGLARGRYVRDGDRIDFQFGVPDDGVDAVGTLIGARLEIRYGPLMLHSDFEDAVYQHLERSEGLGQASVATAP